MFIDEVLMILMWEVELMLYGRFIIKVVEDYRDCNVDRSVFSVGI